jgi:hypothetical protein
MQNMTVLDTLEVRNYKSLKWKTLIVLLLFITVAISGIIQIFSKNFWTAFKFYYVHALFLFAVIIWGIIYYSKSLYYDKELQLRIDKYGIWTPKYKTWDWKDIWYFNTTDEYVGKGDRLYTLEIKLKEGINEGRDYLILPLDNCDIPKEHIRSVLEKYAVMYGIKDLGHEKVD